MRVRAALPRREGIVLRSGPLTITIALAVGLPVAVGCGAESSERAATATGAPRSLLGVVQIDRGGPGAVARLDPRTLRSRSRPVALRGHYWSVSRAPDETRVAIGVSSRARVQLVDLRRWRSRGMV